MTCAFGLPTQRERERQEIENFERRRRLAARKGEVLPEDACTPTLAHPSAEEVEEGGPDDAYASDEGHDDDHRSEEERAKEGAGRKGEHSRQGGKRGGEAVDGKCVTKGTLDEAALSRPNASASAILDDGASEADSNLTCNACASGADEEYLLMCDGCDRALHTYCARPALDAVPTGDWFCEVCALKAHLQKQVSPQQTSPQQVKPTRVDARLIAELRKPSHASRDLWRFTVPLSRTCCQLLEHVREFSEALDRVRLKPLAEQVAELNRQEKMARREVEAEEQERRRQERAETKLIHKELSGVLDSLIKQVEQKAKIEAKEAKEEAKEAAKEAKEAAKEASRLEKERMRAEAQQDKERARIEAQHDKERARLEALQEREAQREARTAAKVHAEVARCLDRLLIKVCAVSCAPA